MLGVLMLGRCMLSVAGDLPADCQFGGACCDCGRWSILLLFVYSALPGVLWRWSAVGV